MTSECCQRDLDGDQLHTEPSASHQLIRPATQPCTLLQVQGSNIYCPFLTWLVVD
jgi:hypothetical protein